MRRCCRFDGADDTILPFVASAVDDMNSDVDDSVREWEGINASIRNIVPEVATPQIVATLATNPKRAVFVRLRFLPRDDTQ